MSIGDFADSQVNVKKAELLLEIKRNRENHRVEFLRAQEGYRTAVTKVLEEHLAAVRAGCKIDLSPIARLVAPQEHTRDYDRVIKMLEMSTATEVSISEHQFQQYVLDDWNWKTQFETVNSTYARR